MVQRRWKKLGKNAMRSRKRRPRIVVSETVVVLWEGGICGFK